MIIIIVIKIIIWSIVSPEQRLWINLGFPKKEFNWFSSFSIHLLSLSRNLLTHRHIIVVAIMIINVTIPRWSFQLFQFSINLHCGIIPLIRDKWRTRGGWLAGWYRAKGLAMKNKAIITFSLSLALFWSKNLSLNRGVVGSPEFLFFWRVSLHISCSLTLFIPCWAAFNSARQQPQDAAPRILSTSLRASSGSHRWCVKSSARAFHIHPVAVTERHKGKTAGTITGTI